MVVVAGAHELDPGGARLVECLEWERGPGASLRCGLSAVTPETEAEPSVPAAIGGDATEYGRWTMRPSTMTPIVMYWPGSNGVGSPSKRTQK